MWSAGKGAWASICQAICLSEVISLIYTLDAHLIFFMIFTFFVENHLLGNTKLSFLVLWFKSYRPCRERALHFSLFLHSWLKITSTTLTAFIGSFQNFANILQTDVKMCLWEFDAEKKIRFWQNGRVVSSPEHGELMVSYCDHPMSVIRCPLSVCNLLKWHLLFSHWTNFNQTLQECFPNHPLPKQLK